MLLKLLASVEFGRAWRAEEGGGGQWWFAVDGTRAEIGMVRGGEKGSWVAGRGKGTVDDENLPKEHTKHSNKATWRYGALVP